MPITGAQWQIDKLRPNPNNPRTELRGEGFDELVASIRLHGILQPLVITREGLVLAGHRRLEAAKVAELESVPVRVFASTEPDDQDTICLIENLLRSDLQPIEVGRYLLGLQERNHLSVSEISEITGITPSTIRKYLQVMQGPAELVQAVAEDRIAMTTASELVKCDSETLAQLINKPDLTKEDVRQHKRYQEKRREPTYQEKRREDISDALEMLETITERLEPYGVDPSVTFGASIEKVEECLAHASSWLAKLEGHIIDWSMILAKQAEREPKLPVESRNRSSLLN